MPSWGQPENILSRTRHGRTRITSLTRVLRQAPSSTKLNQLARQAEAVPVLMPPAVARRPMDNMRHHQHPAECPRAPQKLQRQQAAPRGPAVSRRDRHARPRPARWRRPRQRRRLRRLAEDARCRYSALYNDMAYDDAMSERLARRSRLPRLAIPHSVSPFS